MINKNQKPYSAMVKDTIKAEESTKIFIGKRPIKIEISITFYQLEDGALTTENPKIGLWER